MKLTNSQYKAVSQLFDKYLTRNSNDKISSFKAPTGSGKTFMASELISRMFSDKIGKEQKTIVVFATVSNSELPKQLARKLNEYKKYHDFNNYSIEYIHSPSVAKSKKIEDIKEFYLEDKKVFVFGLSSFGKNTLFFQNKTLENFIQDAKNQNYEIIFIRDEAHIGKKELLSKEEINNFDAKMKEASSFVLEMTATPKSSRNFVELLMNDIRDDDVFLLKEKQILPNDLLGEISNEDLIDHAIKTFIKTKKEYQDNIKDFIIYPAMLVQVMNETDYERDFQKNKDFKEGMDLLENKLKEAGLKYLKYLNSKPEVFGTNVPATLEYASKNDSHIDVIIFKVGPATGWDIPRANMLLQLRNVSSENLNIQTIGRIMRNPIPTLEKNNTTNKYYLYSNYQKPTREMATYSLKNKFINNEDFFLYAGKINRNSSEILGNNEKFRKDVINYIRSPEFHNLIIDLNDEEIIFNSLNIQTATVSNKILNYVHLKIYNLKRQADLEKTFKVSLFEEELKKISKKMNKNIEKVKYVFYNYSTNKLNEILNNNCKWIHSKNPYSIEKVWKLLENYNLWIDNNNPKCVKTDLIKNYGYLLISNEGEKNLQYLDSGPEMRFFEKFIKLIPKAKRENLKFFSKMPTLGSKIYFEYYSKKEARIKKSFMDFAIEYNDKIIMIEVKSNDFDYDEEKTRELLDAYKIYMEKEENKAVNLVLYKDNQENNSGFLSFYDKKNDQWKENCSFNDAIEILFD
ncbi:MAG: DEAD/DEAH box helicase [Metamycoplasmataceae bacterium]